MAEATPFQNAWDLGRLQARAAGKKIEWNQAQLIFRRKTRVMPKHESEMTIVEAAETNPADGASTDTATLSPEAEAASRAEGTASKSEYDQLKAERDQLVDRIARLQAEFENARKRAERERSEYRDYATGNVVEQFLPVLDNFALALKATGSVEQMRHGIELIVKQMDEVLRQLQVSPIPTVGEEFDPRVHEALGSVDRDDMPDQHIAEEIRRGYKIRERMLRPALVRVVHNPKQTAE
jgi:molecular chaperone GrpE